MTAVKSHLTMFAIRLTTSEDTVDSSALWLLELTLASQTDRIYSGIVQP